MSEGSFVCYRELLAATNTVDSCYFNSFNRITNQYQTFLCILRSSSLSIYSIDSHSPKDSYTLLKATIKVFGRINGLGKLNRKNPRNDLLFVALDEGKIVYFEYDLLSNSIKENILQNVEEDAFGIGSDIKATTSGKRICLGSGNEQNLKVSSEFGLLASVIYGDHLLITDISQLMTSDQKINIANHSILLHLQRDLKLVGPIIDISFVYGYSQPVLAILQQRSLLPIGHAANVMHTSTLTLLTIDIHTHNTTILWSQEKLPHDSLRLIDIEKPLIKGSVLVVSQNALLLVRSNVIQALAMNGFAAVTVSPHIHLSPFNALENGLELDASNWVVYDMSLNSLTLLGLLKNKVCLLVNICSISVEVASSLAFHARIIGDIATHSCASLEYTNKLLFVGSRNDKSVLYSLQMFSNSNSNPSSSTIMEDIKDKLFLDYTFISPPKPQHDELQDQPNNSKKRKFPEIATNENNTEINETEITTDSNNQTDDRKPISEVFANKEDEEEFLEVLPSNPLDAPEVVAEDLLFYGSSSDSPSFSFFSMKHNKLELLEIDAFPGVGPIMSAAFTRSSDIFSQISQISWDRTHSTKSIKSLNSVASYIADKEMKKELLLTAGLDQEGKLLKVTNGISMGKVGGRNFPGAKRVYSVSFPKYSLLFISYDLRSRIINCREEHILSQDTYDLKFHELSTEESPFITNAATVNVDCIYHQIEDENNSAMDYLVQITAHTLRIVKVSLDLGCESIVIKDFNLSSFLNQIRPSQNGQNSNEYIFQADVTDNYIEIMTNTRTLIILKFASSSENLELVCFHSTLSLPNNDDSMAIDVQTCSFDFIKHDIVSASWFNSSLSFLDQQIPPIVEQQFSWKDQEEIMMYGDLLSEYIQKEKQQALDAMHVEETNETLPTFTSTSTSSPVLIASDVLGTIYFIDSQNWKCIYQTKSFSVQLESIPVEPTLESNQEKESEPIELYRFIIEMRLFRVQDSIKTNYSNQNNSYLYLFLLFQSGEFVIYQGFEVNNFIVTWNKLYSNIYQNKSLFEKLKFDSTVTTKNGEEASLIDLSYLESEDYLTKPCKSIVFYPQFKEFSDMIIISGNDPKVVIIEKSFPIVQSVGFPEIPYVNFGHHAVFALRSNQYSYFASLWIEQEDLENYRGHFNIKNRAQKQSTLGIYRFLPRQQSYGPNSQILSQPVRINETVHKIIEIHKLTDNKLEKVLLEKKTFVMLSSTEIYRPFQPQVLTPNEVDNEDVLLERFFPNLSSFAQPDDNIAPPPLIKDTQYKVSLLQGSKVIDQIIIPITERVMDIEVLYLSVEKTENASTSFLLPTKSKEKRVFVLVSTLDADKRGEDTQGNGKLILYGLDYAIFEELNEETKEESLSEDKKDTSKSTNFYETVQAKLKQLSVTVASGSILKQMPNYKEINNNNNILNDNFWSNYILTTVGTTMYIYKLNNQTMELDQVSFFFAPFYIASISIMKQYIFISSLFHSVILLFFRESDNSLLLVSKDYDRRVILKTDFMLDCKKLAMVTSDDRGNVQIFHQNNKHPESIQGVRLICQSDFHLGHEVSCLISNDLLFIDTSTLALNSGLSIPMNMNMNSSDQQSTFPRAHKHSSFPLQTFGTRFLKQHNQIAMKRSCTIVGTLDGSMGLLIPVDEKVYKRLALLQRILTIVLPSSFALNVKDFRQSKTWRVTLGSIKLANTQRIVLDGNVLYRFLTLDTIIQEEIAYFLGTTAYLLRENLHEIDYLTRFF